MADYSNVYGAVANVAASYITNEGNRAVNRIQNESAAYIRGKHNEVIVKENERDAVITRFQRWRQEVRNKRVVENASKDQEVMAVNYQRQKDQRRMSSFSDQIRYAEEEGRQAAAAAMSGISGSVVHTIEGATNLRQAMETHAKGKAEKQMDYDYGRAQFSQWYANMDQMDYTPILDNPRSLDYGVGEFRAFSSNPLGGVTVKDVKAIAQGADFFFKTPDAAIDPWAGTNHVN